MLAGLAFCAMLSQYPRSAFQGFSGGLQRESAAVATQTLRVQLLGKSQRVKTQRVKTSENFAEDKMFAEDISEDFSEDRRYHFYWIL